MKDKTGKEIDEDKQAQWGTDDIEPDFPKGRDCYDAPQ